MLVCPTSKSERQLSLCRSRSARPSITRDSDPCKSCTRCCPSYSREDCFVARCHMLHIQHWVMRYMYSTGILSKPNADGDSRHAWHTKRTHHRKPHARHSNTAQEAKYLISNANNAFRLCLPWRSRIVAAIGCRTQLTLAPRQICRDTRPFLPVCWEAYASRAPGHRAFC